MDLDITKERDMPLLSCKRYTMFIGFKGATPDRKKVRDELAKKVKADPELTVIKHIYTRYGVERAKVIANVYSKKEDMLRLEEKQLLSKHSDKKPEEKKEQAA
jgi:ribosomal protein S24E